MKKKHVIALVVAIVLIIAICLIMIFTDNKSEKKRNSVQNEAVNTGIDWEHVEVTATKFKLQNKTGKDISKIYIRNNRTENFQDEISGEIKNDEEKELTYSNYSPLYSYDMEIHFADGTKKSLNSMLAANEIYEGATLELTDLEETVSAVNHNMGVPEDVTLPEGETEVPAEQTVPENTPETEETNAEETEENAEANSEEATEKMTEEANNVTEEATNAEEIVKEN